MRAHGAAGCRCLPALTLAMGALLLLMRGVDAGDGGAATAGPSSLDASALGLAGGSGAAAATAAVAGSALGSHYAAAAFSGATGLGAPEPVPLLAPAGQALVRPQPAPHAAAAQPPRRPPRPPPFRIVGGTEAPRNRYKWMCSLRGRNDFHFCACSLVAPAVVLTAAHCVDHDDAALATPWVEIGLHYLNGNNDTEGNSHDRLRCTQSAVHPEWSVDSGWNDIALCFLDGASRFQPVRLAEEGDSPAPGERVVVMGWGAREEGGTNVAQLHQVEIAVTPPADCNATYGGALRGKQLCAGLAQGGADACQGDSGGPLLLAGAAHDSEDVQVGIVSYGVGCGRPATPGVYTKVVEYRSFIAQQLQARGIAYGPLTEGHQPAGAASAASAPAPAASAPAAPTDASGGVFSRADACKCSSDGWSGGVAVGLTGCGQHGLEYGDTSFWCYAAGGAACATATASQAFPGAAWSDCQPEVVANGSGHGGGGDAAATALQALQGWMQFNAAERKTSGAVGGNRSSTPASRSSVRPAGGAASPPRGALP